MAIALNAKMLPTVLSIIAGSVDAIGFLGLGGLFTAHVTGNLVVLVAHLAIGSRAPLANILSVPVFVAALGSTRLLAGVLERIGFASLRPLLLLQLLLLVGFLALCAALVHWHDKTWKIAIEPTKASVYRPIHRAIRWQYPCKVDNWRGWRSAGCRLI